MAKFDQNYDLRDRPRFIRAILFPQGEPGKKMKSKHAKKKYLAPKSLPTIESKFFNRDEYQLGSLSHFINARITGKVQAKLAWLDSWSRRIFKVQINLEICYFEERGFICLGSAKTNLL
jgi:hypothetical protein